jgi:nucleotide-binding universal stress UspA family protein
VAELLTSLRNFTGLADESDDDVDVLTMALICMGTHGADRKAKQPMQIDFEMVG